MTTKSEITQAASAAQFQRKSNMGLVHTAFRNVNSFKRHRALAEIARKDGNRDKAQYHELKMYKEFDELELALRAIQKGIRELDELTDDDE